MKVTIKNLDQKSFVINTYGLKTVSDLKRKLYNVAVTNLLPERQQLLYAGRVLKDNKLLSSYSIDERKFLLVMARKPWRTLNTGESIQQTTNNNNSINKNKCMTEKIGQTRKPVNVDQGDELNNKGMARDMNEQRKVRIKHIKKKRNSRILMAKSSIKLKATKSVAKKTHKLQNKFKITTSSSASLTHKNCRANNNKRGDSTSSIESTDSQQARRRCNKAKVTTNNKIMKSTKFLLSTTRLHATRKASKMRGTTRKILKKSTQNQVCDEHVLRQIVAMGYNEDDVRRALATCFNNPNEAVDYLIEQVQERVGHQTTAKQRQRQQPANLQKAKAAEQAKFNQANALAFLRQDPDFKNLRRLLRKRPNVLQDVIKRIDETQPELLLMLKEHESEFLQLLHESSAESEDEQCNHCNYNNMHISPEEEKHIARLVRMGFKRQMVILAFIACDRNVERAVDYLCRIDDIHI